MIQTSTTTKRSGRSKAYNFVLLDEFAFVEKNVADAFFTSVYPTISSGTTTKMVIISTPCGINHYYKLVKLYLE